MGDDKEKLFPPVIIYGEPIHEVTLRRRFALLQAAAILLASVREPRKNEIADTVFDAEALLAEIERREAQ